LILQLFQNSISGTFPPNFAALSDTLVQLYGAQSVDPAGSLAHWLTGSLNTCSAIQLGEWQSNHGHLAAVLFDLQQAQAPVRVHDGAQHHHLALSLAHSRLVCVPSDLSFNELTGQIPDLGLPDILSMYACAVEANVLAYSANGERTALQLSRQQPLLGNHPRPTQGRQRPRRDLL